MKTITIHASHSYAVHIGQNLLCQLGQYVTAIHAPATAVIISDSNVWPIYGNECTASLEKAGFHVLHFIFPAGEASKCANTYLSILNFLAENHVTRSDILVALGGGVTGDITGFSAATYLRGIPYIQIPTSLLAMVDSSVGGKTAIDLAAGKNLAGAFWQPAMVLCDIHTLHTLPKEIFRDGCAEIIKYAVLYDPKLFSHLDANTLNFDREYVISRCVELKRDVVALDEFDTGARQKLNLGHTIGHGIEAGSGYRISHGRAVAAGMAVITGVSVSVNLCNGETACKIINLIKKFGLPVQTEYSAESLFYHSLSDKKRAGNTVNLILPREIGDCIISPTPVDQIHKMIEDGLSWI